MRVTEENLDKIIAEGKFAPEGEWIFSASVDRRRGSIVAGERIVCSYEPDSNWAKTPSGNADKFSFMATASAHAVTMAQDLKEARRLLKSAAERIEGDIQGHFNSMRKDYLAKDFIERDLTLNEIKSALAEATDGT